MRYVSCIVDALHDGHPLWSVLEEQLHVSRALVRRAKMASGGLLLDGNPSYTTAPVRTGQTVAIDVTDRGALGPVEPEPGPLAILYEDDDLLAVNKPADQVVHPCPGHRAHTLGNFVLHHLAPTCTTLYPVHRLDLGTSGVLLYAKHGYAHNRLQATLHNQGSGRVYLALCQGIPEQPQQTIDAPIFRPDERDLRRTVDPRGKRALTHYRVVRPVGEGLALVELRLETGRTHQIRVHLAHLGYPLLGDALYGTPSSLIARPALHSWRLELVQPVSGETLRIEAPVPEDMARLLKSGLATAR